MNLDCLTKERNIGSDEILKLLKDKNDLTCYIKLDMYH